MHTSPPRQLKQRTKKATKHTKASSPRASKQSQQNGTLEIYSADGETFAVHTDAFVVVDESINVEALWDEPSATCHICHRSTAPRSNAVLLECDRCLLGYHTSCVALNTVPKVHSCGVGA